MQIERLIDWELTEHNTRYWAVTIRWMYNEGNSEIDDRRNYIYSSACQIYTQMFIRASHIEKLGQEDMIEYEREFDVRIDCQ